MKSIAVSRQAKIVVSIALICICFLCDYVFTKYGFDRGSVWLGACIGLLLGDIIYGE
jgi:hypothetical protein